MDREAADKRAQENASHWLVALGVLMVLGFVGVIGGAVVGAMIGSTLDAGNQRTGLEGAAGAIGGLILGGFAGLLLGAASTPRALRWLRRGQFARAEHAEQAEPLEGARADSPRAGAPAPIPARGWMQVAAADLFLVALCTMGGSQAAAQLEGAARRADGLMRTLDSWLGGLASVLMWNMGYIGTGLGFLLGLWCAVRYTRLNAPRSTSAHD